MTVPASHRSSGLPVSSPGMADYLIRLQTFRRRAHAHIAPLAQVRRVLQDGRQRGGHVAAHALAGAQVILTELDLEFQELAAGFTNLCAVDRSVEAAGRPIRDDDNDLG